VITIPVGDRFLYLDWILLLAIYVAFKVLILTIKWGRSQRRLPQAYKLPILGLGLYLAGGFFYLLIGHRPGLFLGGLCQVLGLILLLNAWSGWFANRKNQTLLILNCSVVVTLLFVPGIASMDLGQLRAPTYTEQDLQSGNGIDIRSTDVLPLQIKHINEEYLPIKLASLPNVRLLSLNIDHDDVVFKYQLIDPLLFPPSNEQLNNVWQALICRHSPFIDLDTKSTLHQLEATDLMPVYKTKLAGPKSSACEND
jgi:hypothetical protein